MLPKESTSRASMSSLLLPSARLTSEPSKYNDQVPLVDSPSVTGLKARISSSAAETPGTVALPMVEISTWPLDSKDTASIPSLLVLKPTSTPFRYILNVPAVTLPSEVALN